MKNCHFVAKDVDFLYYSFVIRRPSIKIAHLFISIPRQYVFQNKVFRFDFLKRHHDNSLTKHFEFEKTNELLFQKYYWSNMFKNVKYYVNICDNCQCTKVFQHWSYDKLNALSQSKSSWQEIIMNFIIDLFRNKWRDQNDWRIEFRTNVCVLKHLTNKLF